MRRQRRDAEAFSMSFLDCICCGFGAVILLLVVTEYGDNTRLQVSKEDLQMQVEKDEQALHEIRGEALLLEKELRARIAQLSEEQSKLARLRGDLSKIEGQYKASENEEDAMKKLTDVALGRARRDDRGDPQAPGRGPAPGLRAAGRRRADRQRVRDLHRRHLGLDAVAELALRRAEARRGAEHLPEAQGHPGAGRRGRVHVQRLSRQVDPGLAGAPQGDPRVLPPLAGVLELEPVGGIIAAVRTFWTTQHSISIYVFGDEFTGPSIQDVVDTVDRINRSSKTGQRLVRIHALGFPIPASIPSTPACGMRR
jgi:hypothetical protein